MGRGWAEVPRKLSYEEEEGVWGRVLAGISRVTLQG